MTKKPSITFDISSYQKLNIGERLREAGIKPNKALGQNFLINPGVYQKILAALRITPGDTIVEVGPGLGTLTHHLARAGAKVIGVEKDRALAEYLKKEFPVNSRVEIINQDILKFDPGNYKSRSHSNRGSSTQSGLKAGSYKLVGNIPYYLTSRLIRRILESWPTPKSVILTVQKEVGQRITAIPPNMSLLAVAVQLYAKASIEGQISKGSFYPAPKIDSSIIKFTPLTQPPDKKFAKHFFQIVHAGFAGKRKQLGGNLARNLKMTKEIVKAKLSLIGIAYERRAETVSMEEWAKITKTLL